MSSTFPTHITTSIRRAQHKQKPGKGMPASVTMVSRLRTQSDPPPARTARAYTQQPAAPRHLLPGRPRTRFRLQSSDTSPREARPGGRGRGGARPRGGAWPRGGAHSSLPHPVWPGFSRLLTAGAPARCLGTGMGKSSDSSPRPQSGAPSL